MHTVTLFTIMMAHAHCPVTLLPIMRAHAHCHFAHHHTLLTIMRAHAHCHLAHHHEGTCRTHHHEGACTLSACSPPICIKMAKRSCLDRSVRTRASLLEQVQKPAVHMNTCSGHVMSHFYTFCFSSSIHENRHSKHNKPLIRNKQRGVAEGQIINKLIFLWSFSCFFMNWVLKRQH